MIRTSGQTADTAFATALRSAYTAAFRLIADEAEAGAATLAAVEAARKKVANGGPEISALRELRRVALHESVARLRSRGLRSGTASELRRPAAPHGAGGARMTFDAVLALPDAMRAVFVLRAVERLEDDRVARLLGLDESDVGRLFVAAVAALRASEAGGECENW
jgi:DNA-directed RNA polymerase specialized sigma24 family protein